MVATPYECYLGFVWSSVYRSLLYILCFTVHRSLLCVFCSLGTNVSIVCPLLSILCYRFLADLYNWVSVLQYTGLCCVFSVFYVCRFLLHILC